MPTAEFSITSADPSLPRRLLGAEPQPETAREIHNAGMVLYHGSERTTASGRHRHDFSVEFGTENSAGVVANWMWTALHGHVSSLEIGGDEVPVQNGAIKRALLTHATAV
jgi:hypothetical protein